jgi:hypothetical protein
MANDTDIAFKQKQQQLLEAKKSFFKESQAEKGQIEKLRADTLDALRAQQAEGLAAGLAGQQAAQSGAMAQVSIENQFLNQQTAARQRALEAQTGYLEFGAKLDTEATKKAQDYNVALQSLANKSRGFFGFNKDEFDAQVKVMMANEPDPAVQARIQEMANSVSGGAGSTFGRFLGVS